MNQQNTLPALYAIANIDDHSDPLSFVTRLFEAGVTLLQLRSKTYSQPAFKSFIESVLELRNGLNYTEVPKVIINDYPTLCVETGADGVHIGQEDGSISTARDLIGPNALLGVSTHTERQFKTALKQAHKLNYIALGPIFESKTKQGHAAVVGIEQLKSICKSSTLPIVAIGGITTKNGKEVYRAGATSIAVVSDLAEASHLRNTVSTYEDLRS